MHVLLLVLLYLAAVLAAITVLATVALLVLGWLVDLATAPERIR